MDSQVVPTRSEKHLKRIAHGERFRLSGRVRRGAYEYIQHRKKDKQRFLRKYDDLKRCIFDRDPYFKASLRKIAIDGGFRSAYESKQVELVGNDCTMDGINQVRDYMVSKGETFLQAAYNKDFSFFDQLTDSEEEEPSSADGTVDELIVFDPEVTDLEVELVEDEKLVKPKIFNFNAQNNPSSVSKYSNSQIKAANSSKQQELISIGLELDNQYKQLKIEKLKLEIQKLKREAESLSHNDHVASNSSSGSE